MFMTIFRSSLISKKGLSVKINLFCCQIFDIGLNQTISLKFSEENRMPFLTIHTNTKIRNTAEFMEEAVDVVAKVLGKPKSYIVLTLDTQSDMLIGGNPDNKGALIEMKSIGFGGHETVLVKALTDLLVDLSDAERECVNIELVDMPASKVAMGGKLFG